MQRYDLLVIGSGPSGQRAAIQASKLGHRAAVVEQLSVVGGVTAHTGTIPSKTLRETVLYLSGWRQRGFYGQGYRVKSSIAAEDLIQRLQHTVRQQIEVIQHQLQRNGVDVIVGQAKFASTDTLAITDPSGNEIMAAGDRIVIATGTVPRRPPEIPFDDVSIIDSDGILNVKDLPRTLTVIGAGVIGVEYATILSALDIKTTLIDGRNQMLGFLDEEVVDELRHDMRERGIRLYLNEKVAAVERTDSGPVVRLESGRSVGSEMVMVAAGRQGATGSLGLEDIGIETDGAGRIPVSDHYQSKIPHIYAVGDVIGFPALASTSAEQGRRAACHALGVSSNGAATLFPFGVYAVPEISVVGETEQSLREQGIAFETGVCRLRETARGQIMGLRQGLLKMLFSLDSGHRLLGAHAIGEGSTELIHIAQSVITLKGGLEYFLEAVFNYPTLAEAYKIAALDAHNKIAHH